MRSVLLSAAFGFAFCGSTGFAATSACNDAASGVCVETNNPNITIDCEDGVVVSACEASGRTGTCMYGTAADGVFARFYPAFPGDAKAECEASNGVYVAG